MYKITIQFLSGASKVTYTEVQPGFNEKGTAVMVRKVVGGVELGIIYSPTTSIRYVECDIVPDKKE